MTPEELQRALDERPPEPAKRPLFPPKARPLSDVLGCADIDARAVAHARHLIDDQVHCPRCLERARGGR